jgi:hypothetical protein
MPRTVTLTIPDELYESLARVAAQTRQTPDELAACWLTDGLRGVEEDPLLKLAGCIGPEAGRPEPAPGDRVSQEPARDPGLIETPRAAGRGG